MLIIREAVLGDFEGIWPIFRAIVMEGQTYAFSPGTTLEDAREAWFAADGVVFVALENKHIVGTYRLGPNFPGLGDHVANAAYMVDQGHRGHGVGSAMCRHSLDQARADGFRAMQFNYVVSTNAAAIRIWERFGFEIIGKVPKAFRHRLLGATDVLVMHRYL